MHIIVNKILVIKQNVVYFRGQPYFVITEKKPLENVLSQTKTLENVNI